MGIHMHLLDTLRGIVFICCASSTISLGSGASIAVLCNANFPLNSRTTVYLDPGTHYPQAVAGKYCVAGNLTDLVILGSADRETIVDCSRGNVGFLFSNIVNLTLERITFRSCGQTIPNDLQGNLNSTPVYLGRGQKAVLLFDHCTNIKLQFVSVDQYYGLAIASVNGMGRTTLHGVNVTNSRTPTDAESRGKDDLSCSGSGIAFIYTDHSEHTENNITYLDLTRVTLRNNTLELPPDELLQLQVSIRDTEAKEPISLTGASGLFLYTAQLTYHLDTAIQECIFENNLGDVGAVLVMFRKMIHNTRLHIQDTVFSNNMATSEGLGQGGALMLAFSLSIIDKFQFPNYPNDLYKAITISDCTFNGNVAESGGAIFIHRTPQNVSNYSIEISNSTFSDNSALFGPGIMTTSLKSTFVSKDPYIFLNDVHVYGNKPHLNATALQDTAVLLFTGLSIVEITGSENADGSRFHDNEMGVLLTSNTNIILRGRITFYNNHGFHGGAITLYDNSILFFHEGSTVLFRENTALQSGGAIYADSLGSAISRTCVIQVLGPSKVVGSNTESLELSITFQNNSAGESGNSIYADPLYQCFNIPESSIIQTGFPDDNDDVYGSIFRIDSRIENGISDIASSPERLCMCTSAIYNSTECEMTSSFSKNVSVVPGQTFEVFLVPLDRAGQPVSSILSSDIKNSQSSYTLGRDQSLRSLPGTSSCIPTKFTIYGPENGNLTLILSSITILKSTVCVTVESCPPGFVLQTEKSLEQCVCSDFMMTTIGTVCNTTTYTIKRPEQVWFGLHDINDTSSDVVYVSTCPVGHCNDNLIEIDLTIPNHLCMSGRTGLLCGTCKSGLSTVFGSAECLECSNAWLAMILVFAVLGVLLVFLLFLLDLTVTHGTITGLIFYVNVVSVNHSIFFRGSNHGFLFVFISLLNLELGYPQCFYNGMSEVAKVGLQYTFPAYLLLMCLIIILLSRWVKIVQRLTAKSGIQVLSTLFYLVYSKFLRTAIDSFSSATLHSDTLDPVTIWLSDGNLHYCEGIHIFLFLIAAVAMLVFLIPYPLYLTLINLTQKTKFCSPQRLKPFLDAYLAPYKDVWRPWFGMRVIILFIVCVIFAIVGTDDPGLNLLLQALFVLVFMVLQAHCRPFKNFYISCLDLSFLLNYTIMSLATTHIVDTENYERKQDQVVSVMVSLVFIVFCGIISYHIFLALRKVESFTQMSDKCLNTVKGWFDKMTGTVGETPPPEAEERGTPENGDIAMPQRQPTMTEIVVTNEGVQTTLYNSEQFREPVLEYITTNSTSH